MKHRSTDVARRPNVIDELTRAVRSVNVLIGNVQEKWATALELTVPQWNILVTIADSEDPLGLSVKSVSEALTVTPPFVVHQSRPLEARGLIKRTSSSTDKRFVYLSITPKAKVELAHLAKSRDAVTASIKKEVGEAATFHTVELLQHLERCLLRCRQRLQIED